MTANPSLAKHPRVEDWITVRPDGFVEVRTGKVDIGQRISTAVALIAAREIGVPFDRIAIVSPDTDLSPDEGYTSGSNSMEQSGHAIRFAASSSRAPRGASASTPRPWRPGMDWSARARRIGPSASASWSTMGPSPFPSTRMPRPSSASKGLHVPRASSRFICAGS